MDWIAAPTDQALFARLARHVCGLEGEAPRIVGVETVALKGGYVSKAVDRLDLTLAKPGGTLVTASFVRKGCLAREVRALELVSSMEGAVACPQILAAWTSPDRPDDPAANGFVTPFYAGPALHFGDPIPTAVIATLARLHATYADPGQLGWTWTFDAGHLERLRNGAIETLSASERFRRATPDHGAWLERLRRAAGSDLIAAATESLPRCLTHGDMHPGNVVRHADGTPAIIDWGNVCIAPPMLDVANIIAIDTPEWETYLAAYRAAGGVADAASARRGYWWARAATALMYVPWAAENSSRAPDLVAQIEAANERLASDQLAQPDAGVR
jgi:hypothetical protein